MLRKRERREERGERFFFLRNKRGERLIALDKKCVVILMRTPSDEIFWKVAGK